jgi:hypothetical protein
MLTSVAISANAVVRRRSAFVLVDFMGDLMGGNRTTFEYDAIRLVG